MHLGNSWFTMLYQFQVYSKVDHLYIYICMYMHMYIHSFWNSLPIQAFIEGWVEIPVLYTRSLLVICFIYSSVYRSIQASQNGTDGKEPTCQHRRHKTTSSIWEDTPEEYMATHSNIFAWRIPWKEEPNGLQRVRHNWSYWASIGQS